MNIHTRSTFIFLLAILCTGVYSQEEYPVKAPFNKEFLRALENIKDPANTVPNTGGIPTPILPGFQDYDRSYYQDKSYPVVFDMRDSTWLTPVKNQTSNGCWAFATMGSVESRWKVLGLGEFDLSENNLKFCHGFDSARSFWGNHWMGTAYFARLSGPLLEYQDPNSGGTQFPHQCMDTADPVAFIRDARYLPNDMNVIKDHLMSVGAIYTMMFYSATYYNDTTFTYYYDGTPGVNHCVAIVGWNDTLTTDGGQGAWIIRNSYGTSWGDGGYFYVSYNDNSILDYNCYWPERDETVITEITYLYDELGNFNSTGYGSETGYGIVKFISSDTNRLIQVGTYAMASNSEIEIRIYENFDGTSVSGLLGSIPVQTCPWPGLYSFDIPEHIDLEFGEDFYVWIKYMTPGYNWPIPIEDTIADYAYPAIEADVCWISGSGASGTWFKIGNNIPGYFWDLSVNVYAEQLSVWTGTAGNDWNNPTNWQGGNLPGTEDHVLIPSGKPNYPLANSGADIQIRSLELEENSFLTIPAGKSMAVAQNILIRSSAAGTGSLIDLGSLSMNGQAVIERYLAGSSNGTYHYISSPVIGATAATFTGAYLYEYDEPNQEWDNLSAEDPLAIAKGYNVKVSSSGKYIYTGAGMHNGNCTFSGLTYNTGGPDDEDYAGFHLSGNPYPSAIDWDHAGITSTNVDDAIYYWDGEDEVYKSYVNGAGTLGATNEVPAGQGFFIRVSGAGETGEIQFSDAARIHSLQSFYKEQGDNLISLRLFGDGHMDECIIRMLQDATLRYDGNFDAYKLMDVTRPQIYSMSSDDRKLSINTMPETKTDAETGISLLLPNAGKYDISVSIPENYLSRYMVILEDMENNRTVRLAADNNLVVETRDKNTRRNYRVHFIPLEKNTVIYGVKDAVMIKSTTGISGTARVFNLSGQEIRSTELDQAWMKRIDLPGWKGILIVSIESDSGMITERVYLP